MRIGFDARMMGVGQRGIGRYVNELLRSMVEASEHEWWIILQDGGDIPMWLQSRTNVHTVIEQSRWYTLKEQIVLPRVLGRLPVDLVHIPHFNVPFLWLWSTCRTPLVVTIHDCILAHHPTSSTTTRSVLLWYIKRWVHAFTMRLIMKHAQAVIVPSQSVAQDCERFYGGANRRFDVIGEGVNLAPHSCGQPSCKAAEESAYILTVGSAYPHKNLRWIGNVMEGLEARQASRSVRWVHVGRQDAFWRTLANDLPPTVRSSLTALGEVSDEELAGWYAHARALLVPSLVEGYGLAIGEALSQATPVVCSDIPAFQELHGGQSHVTLLPLDDVKSWVRAVGFLIDHPSRVDPIALELPTWQQAARSTLGVYQRVMGRYNEKPLGTSW